MGQTLREVIKRMGKHPQEHRFPLLTDPGDDHYHLHFLPFWWTLAWSSPIFHIRNVSTLSKRTLCKSFAASFA